MANERVPFAKPALSLDAQVDLLISRGMEIEDRAAAVETLRHVNYYRLGAYWLPFEADHATHTFGPGTRFGAVVGLYEFDRELRALLMATLERVEISLRTQWAHRVACSHGAHGYLDPNLARDPKKLTEHRSALVDEVKRARDEVFLKHHRSRYLEELPAAWVACEVMSFGTLSKWYSNLRPIRTRRAIADTYEVDEGLLQSWLHHLTMVRNRCAHHNRLWNHEFAVIPERPRRGVLAAEWQPHSRRLYNTLLVLTYLMDHISPGHVLRGSLDDLIRRYRIARTELGYPPGWQPGGPFWAPNSSRP